jgi:osmoprotectant transport system permease protein
MASKKANKTVTWNGERFFNLLLQRIPTAVGQHICIVLLTIGLSCFIALPVGILLTRPKFRKFNIFVMGGINVLQSVPSLALLALAMPLIGIGLKAALAALTFLAIMPIAKNTVVGIDEVDVNVREAAIGMGMTSWQILREVELPLAMPVILTGIRTSIVLAISSGTLASIIGAGGLGDLIYLGLLMNWKEALLLGAAFSAFFATICDLGLGKVARRFVPPGFVEED